MAAHGVSRRGARRGDGRHQHGDQAGCQAEGEAQDRGGHVVSDHRVGDPDGRGVQAGDQRGDARTENDAEQRAHGGHRDAVSQVVPDDRGRPGPHGQHRAHDAPLGLHDPGDDDVLGDGGGGQEEHRESHREFGEAIEVFVQRRVGRLLVTGLHVQGAAGQQ